MKPASFAPSSDSLPPTSARVSVAPRSGTASRVQVVARTDPGRVRAHNEDNFLIDRSLSLCVVCDGMGGHAAGDVASGIAVHAFRKAVAASRDILEDYVLAPRDRPVARKRDVLQLLEQAAVTASREVHAVAQGDEKKGGMGTTLVAAVVLGAQAFMVHVGDSRAYLLRRGAVEQLTRDHNVYNELILRRKLGSEAARRAAPKHAITRAVGVYEHCEPDTLVLDVAAGDRLLLCTDGLSRYFEPPQGCVDDLPEALSNEDDEALVESLIEHANQRGGADNVTAAVMTLGQVGQHDSATLEWLESSRFALSASPLFGGLDEPDLYRVLAVAETASYGPGQAVMKEGDVGGELYLALTGRLSVSIDGTEIARLGPGDHVGEMSLALDQPRSACVTASTRAELLVLSREEFWKLLRTDHELGTKLLWRLTRVLAERLGNTNDALLASRRVVSAQRELPRPAEWEAATDDGSSLDTLRPPSFLPADAATDS